MIDFLYRVRDYVASAGLKEALLFLGVIIAGVVVFSVLSLFMDKWEGDFRHKMLIWLLYAVAFIVSFAVLFWLDLNNWEPIVGRLREVM